MRADGTLAGPASGGEASRSYLSTTAGRQLTGENGLAGNLGDDGIGQLTFVNGPDQLRYVLDFGAPTAIAGPINLTLWASSTAPDTDFFVDLLDVAPGGEVSYLQRGLQRASHRAIDDDKSDFVPSGTEAGAYYRAHHPHTNTTLQTLTPLVPEKFEIEIFPVGHLFRAGHKLVIQIHAPPPQDPLSIYVWVSGQPPAINTVFHDAEHRSSLLLPVMPVLPPLGTAPACGEMIGVPCFTPLL
ncbi:MAG: CocE/NonD family hydrolase C-terminal non-catalytic domain-containing protein [Candidatus Binatia bacterium]